MVVVRVWSYFVATSESLMTGSISAVSTIVLG